MLKKNITAAIDKKTAITNVSVSLQNPSITAIVADSVVHRLQEHIIDYRTSKAKEDCVYLEKLFEERKQEYYAAQKKYAKYVDTHDNLVLQSIRAEQERLQNDMSLAYQVYSQVINQLQIARAKVQASVCSSRATCRTIKTFRYRSENLCFAICIFFFVHNSRVGTVR